MKPLIQDHLLFPEILWQRPQNIYKRQAGKVFILAGSKSMSGAGLLMAEAAFRTGIGLLVLGYPKNLKEVYQSVLPEMMSLVLPETPAGTIARDSFDAIARGVEDVDAVAIGPGLTRNSETVNVLQRIVREIGKPMVIDADGLNAISEGNAADIFQSRRALTIITPHYGEMSRLSQMDSKKIEEYRIKVAQEFAQEWNVTLVLKGHETVIAEPGGRLVVNRSGSPALATAGTGDVLAGMITALVAQNLNKPFEAAATAVYLHGRSGELAHSALGERSVMASDVIHYLPEAIKKSEQEL